jgi:hypothetical protein
VTVSDGQHDSGDTGGASEDDEEGAGSGTDDTTG